MHWKSYCLFALIGSMSVKGGDHPFRLGLETFYSNPTGTLNKAFSASTGLGGSLFIFTDLGEGHGVRCDVGSYAEFSDKGLPGNSNNDSIKANLTSVSTALNYVWHPNKTQNGPFLQTGIGIRRFIGTADIPDVNPPVVPKNDLGGNAIPTYTRYACDSGSKLAFQVAGGYDFMNGLGLIVRYHWNRSLGHTLATIESGLNYRF